LMVPLLAMHRDEKYFSEPMKYKPLRFLQTANDVGQCEDKTKSNVFIGFGIGGSQCVGTYRIQIILAMFRQYFSHRNYRTELCKVGN